MVVSDTVATCMQIAGEQVSYIVVAIPKEPLTSVRRV